MSDLKDQEYLTREEIKRTLTSEVEHIFDPESVKKPAHKFEKRGIAVVCAHCGLKATTR